MAHTHMADDFDVVVRTGIYNRFVETGRAPEVRQLADALHASERDVRGALKRLADGHIIALQPTGEILMADPFWAIPTAFHVEGGTRSWWAGCIWEALGIPILIGADADIYTSCPDCGEAMLLQARNGALLPSQGTIHFTVPARHWWDDVVFT
ncbi:MAG: organomercurial lyase [Vicinamibacterales bacterium]